MKKAKEVGKLQKRSGLALNIFIAVFSADPEYVHAHGHATMTMTIQEEGGLV